jgi:hypothetical protein
MKNFIPGKQGRGHPAAKLSGISRRFPLPQSRPWPGERRSLLASRGAGTWIQKYTKMSLTASCGRTCGASLPDAHPRRPAQP